jgi:hypothetical protein
VATFTLKFADADALRACYDTALSQGRAFVPGCTGVVSHDESELVLEHAGRVHKLAAEIVHVKEDEPRAGVGLLLAPLDEDGALDLSAFVELAPADGEETEPIELAAVAVPKQVDLAPVVDFAVAVTKRIEPVELAVAVPEKVKPESQVLDFVLDPLLAARPAEEPSSPATEESPEEAEPPEPPADEMPPEEEEVEGSDARQRNMFERIQALTVPEQLKLAGAGTLQERVVLERMYGPMVWESLLRNSRLTAPEAARIAKKGTLPRPLVDLIASKAGWLATVEVQRALLSNPRSSPMVVRKVLRVMPKTDLLLVPHQTAYPLSVRQAAKGMLGRA